MLLPGSPKSSHFRRGISERRLKSDLLVFIGSGSFVFMGRIFTWEGGRKGGRDVLDEEARVASSWQKMIK